MKRNVIHFGINCNACALQFIKLKYKVIVEWTFFLFFSFFGRTHDGRHSKSNDTGRVGQIEKNVCDFFEKLSTIESICRVS